MTMLGIVLLVALTLQLLARDLRLVARKAAGKRPLLTAAETAMMVGVALLLGSRAFELLT